MNWICEEDTFSSDEYSYFVNDSIIDDMIKLSPSLNESVECYYYISGYEDCLENMETVVSEEGVCFTLNALPNTAIYTPKTVQYYEKENNESYVPIWTPESGFLNGVVNLTMKPYPAMNVGIGTGLHMVLMSNSSEQDYACSIVQGYRVILSSPADALASSSNGYYIPPDGLTLISITPNVMDTSEDLRSYSRSERHCIYPHEHQLEFFQLYTQDNCRLECISKMTFNNCKCVPYFMPRTKNMPICGLRSKECYYNTLLTLTNMRIAKLAFEDELEICSCLPACKTIKYSADVSQTSFDMANLVKRNVTEYASIKNISHNVIIVYFKDSEYLASKRSELYGYGGFIAQCGGLLGLCCGFSILSLVELIYYVTVRMWSDNCKQDKQQKIDQQPSQEQLTFDSDKKGSQDLNYF